MLGVLFCCFLFVFDKGFFIEFELRLLISKFYNVRVLGICLYVFCFLYGFGVFVLGFRIFIFIDLLD